MKIVYCSNSGHTQKLAYRLGKELNIEVYPINRYKKDQDKVIYLGWIFASHISGLTKINANNLKCVIGVGMNENSDKNFEELQRINKVECPLFYLKGGIDIKLLKGVKKIIIKMMYRSFKKNQTVENEIFMKEIEHPTEYIQEEDVKKLVEKINSL